MADGSDRDGESGDATVCPECGEDLPADARFCPSCVSTLDGDGDAVDLSELEGDVLPEDSSELLVEDDGLRRASGRIRALAGLAASIPLAPLVLFLVGAVVELSVWTGAFVFVTGWVCGAAVLSRARVPAEAFGRSLYLMAVATLLLPVALSVGGVEAWTERLSVSFDALAAVSLGLSAALIALGTFVTRQARKRVTGERRGFESYREE